MYATTTHQAVGFLFAILSCLPLSGLLQAHDLPNGFPVTDGLVLFLDGEAVETAGTSVIRMMDRSGRGNHAYAPPDIQPSRAPGATPSGLDAILFNGVSHRLDVPANPANFDGRGKTSVAVFRPDALGLRRVINLSFSTMDADDSEAPERDSAHSVYTHVSGAVRVENRTAAGISIAVSTPGGLVNSSTFVIGANRWSPNGDTLAVAVNGDGDRFTGLATGADANPAGHLRTRVGAGGGETPANYFSGDLAAAVVFNRALSDAEMELVEQYLRQRYLHPVSPSTRYWQWVEPFNLPEPLAGPADDASGDGISNLAKFFFDEDPRRASAGPRLRIDTKELNGREYPVLFPGRRPDSSPVDFQLETSGNLIDWTSDGTGFLILDPTRGEPFVRFPLLSPHASARYFRARLSLSEEIRWIRLGERFFTTNLQTGSAPNSVPSGTPVIPMWTAQYARSGEPAGGFTRVSQAQHRVVWRPMARSEGAFNHHAALGYFHNQFVAMWSNHTLGEDASGQRVLYSTSANGSTWSEPAEMFPAPDEIRGRGEPGVTLRPDRWVVTGGRCFAVAYSRTQGTPNSSFPVARELLPDGGLGQPFTLRPENRTELLPVYMRDSEPHWTPETAGEILDWYEKNTVVSWWAQMGEGVPNRGVDGATLIEPLTYKAADGETVLLMRFHPQSGGIRHNNRMYVSFQESGGGWSPPHPTNIPDSPNRTEPLVLPDGTVLLIGGQIAPALDAAEYLFRDPLTISVSRDGYVFDRVYSLRDGAPQGYRFSGIGGRTGGFAYNSSVVRNGWLYTLYSVGKEDIEITRVPLNALGL